MELDSVAEFDPARDAEFFASVPAAPAVVRIEPRANLADARPYLIRTADLRARILYLAMIGSHFSSAQRIATGDDLWRELEALIT